MWKENHTCGNLLRMSLCIGPLRFAFMITITATIGITGCGDEAGDNCADCPNLALQPACIEASEECGQVGNDIREQCLQEARELCA